MVERSKPIISHNQSRELEIGTQSLAEIPPSRSRLTFNLRNFANFSNSRSPERRSIHSRERRSVNSRERRSIHSPSGSYSNVAVGLNTENLQSMYNKNLSTKLGTGTTRFGNLVYQEELKDSLERESEHVYGINALPA
jgi:hypothetical protein